MFNPLITDLSSLSDSELDAKISELGQKYWQVRNPQLQGQIAVALEMHKDEARTRREKQRMKQQEENGDNELDNLINIS